MTAERAPLLFRIHFAITITMMLLRGYWNRAKSS